ncbi:bifunctional 2-polyprenyl-6-hydroxyphenol methylase/3-demethylubiquinol 3-O-methyltransferase UbiG [Palleronia caenipelagi]|uniref:3-demethylubiquinone-9 3-O-methyltransferase n=1 Tax=Palleronia caenipelagi TaxID=2489174 RepID=A0A547Q8H9_9RHOB|nr:bifunctional 2-polyprenyl-6-hydroxyphenol methylase/3-demethylubiquinol 3-O-methyltransferase UbiG [Palleronia caenipelagi]TRD22690.1 3-demethylubiquinone-9 3-O-methyltransferase [Palleronia caenipelagi]
MNAETRNNLSIYDDVAQKWWADDVRWLRVLRKMVPGRLKWFNRHMEWQGKKVLDLGCAGGFMAEALAERGANVTGIDPAAEAIAAARAHAEAGGLTIRYDVGVGEDLPYESGHFDAVVCVDVLEHVQDLDQVLREVERVLKPGGRFLFDTLDRNPVARFAAITMAENVLRVLPKGAHDPDMFIKKPELRAALTRAGLAARDFTGLGPVGIDGKLDPVFGPIPVQTVIYMGYADKGW